MVYKSSHLEFHLTGLCTNYTLLDVVGNYKCVFNCINTRVYVQCRALCPGESNRTSPAHRIFYTGKIRKLKWDK